MIAERRAVKSGQLPEWRLGEARPAKPIVKRAAKRSETISWAQCELCSKWRMLPAGAPAPDGSAPWRCSELEGRSCDDEQEPWWARCSLCRKWRALPHESPPRARWQCADLEGVEGCDDPEEPDDAGVVEWAQCDSCGKWRMLPAGTRAPDGSAPWRCSDLKGRSCADEEEPWSDDDETANSASASADTAPVPTDWAQMIGVAVSRRSSGA